MKLSRDAAELMMARAVQWNAAINETIREVESLCTNEAEFKALRRECGGVMAEILDRIVNPVIAQYPALKPKPMP